MPRRNYNHLPYLLAPDIKPPTAEGHTDRVIDIWEAENRWIIGTRHPNGSIDYSHRTYGSLGELCYLHETTDGVVRAQTKRVIALRALQDKPAASLTTEERRRMARLERLQAGALPKPARDIPVPST